MNKKLVNSVGKDTEQPKDLYVLDLETSTDLNRANLMKRKELLFEENCTFICASMYAKVGETCDKIFDFYGRENAERAVLNLPSGIYYTWNGARFDTHFIYHLLRKAMYVKKEDFNSKSSKKKQLKNGEFDYLLANSRFIKLSFRNDNGIVEIRDACLLFTCSLANFIKNTCPEYPKLVDTYDYQKLRVVEADFSDTDIEYCRADVRGFAIGLHRINRDFEAEFEMNIIDSYTAGSFAMKYAQKFIDLDLPDVNFSRDFVAGGRVFVNPQYAGKVMNGLTKIDANSFYPSIMVGSKLPYGNMVKKPMNSQQLSMFLDGNVDKYVFAKLMSGVARYNAQFSPINTLDKYGNRDYPHMVGSSDNVYVDDNILRDKKFEHDGVFLCHIFESKVGIFEYLKKIFELKNTYKKEGKKALELAVKIILNSTYGKFIQRDLIKEYDFFEGVIQETGSKKSLTAWYLYPPMGAAITANCRYLLTQYMNLLGDNFIYCDTDSLVFMGDCPKEIPLGIELGQWKEEATPNGLNGDGKSIPKSGKGIFFQRKTYGMDLDGETEITFCGISKKAVEAKYPNGVTIDQLQKDMNDGIVFNVLQGNRTKNGVVLIERARVKKYVEMM